MNEISTLINRRTAGGAIIFAVLLCLALAGLVYFSKPPTSPPVEGTPVIALIPAPTLTTSPTPTPNVSATPTLDVPPSPPPGVLAIGAFVQISGTGGDGLRLRTGPGLDNPVGFLGLESEVFQVIDGPREADGFTWFLVESPYDEGQKRSGWAVSNYLQTIQNP
jgi:hypothetical protein